MNAPQPPVAPVDERVVIVTLLVGMAFLAVTCVVVGVVALAPKAWRLVQERRAREAAWDAEVFDEGTPIYDELAAEREHFAQWDAELGADR